MSITVNVQEAKTRLSELLARVEAGEDVTIARAGHPVAHLTPVSPPAPRQFGIFPELDGMTIPEDFDDPLPESELSRWE